MNYHKIVNAILVVFLLPLTSLAKDYNASLFGVKSDGLTLNTRSIQKGIDFISANGGGRLVFYVGRYLTGSIRLKSNVTIKLEEGAVLVAAPSVYDYNSSAGIKALVSAEGQKNIGISGKGVIEGRGTLLLKNMDELKARGFLLDSLTVQPALLGFSNCSQIAIDSVNMIDAAGAVQRFSNCNDIKIATITIKSNNSNDPAVVFSENTGVYFINSYVEVPGKPMVWTGDSRELKLEKTIDSKGSALQP